MLKISTKLWPGLGALWQSAPAGSSLWSGTCSSRPSLQSEPPASGLPPAACSPAPGSPSAWRSGPSSCWSSPAGSPWRPERVHTPMTAEKFPNSPMTQHNPRCQRWPNHSCRSWPWDSRCFLQESTHRDIKLRHSEWTATLCRSHTAGGVYWVNIYPALLTWGSVALWRWRVVVAEKFPLPQPAGLVTLSRSPAPRSLAAFLYGRLLNTLSFPLCPGSPAAGPWDRADRLPLACQDLSWWHNLQSTASPGGCSSLSHLNPPFVPHPQGSMWERAELWGWTLDTQCLHHQHSGALCTLWSRITEPLSNRQQHKPGRECSGRHSDRSRVWVDVWIWAVL